MESKLRPLAVQVTPWMLKKRAMTRYIEMESNAGTKKDKRSVCRQRCCGENSSVFQHTGYQLKAEIF